MQENIFELILKTVEYEESTEAFINRDECIFVISVASRMTQLHPNTLRKYEKEGVISPNRSEGKQRMYSYSDLNRLKIAKMLNERFGLGVHGIRIVLDCIVTIQQISEVLNDDSKVKINSDQKQKLNDFIEKFYSSILN